MSIVSGTRLSIIDDSGLLSIVDAPSYSAFVDPDWTYEQLLEHFVAEMAKGTILVWECGDGGRDYQVELREGFTDAQGFRAAVGSLKVSSGVLNLASYTALTMAAQFQDQSIPSPHEVEAAFDVPWNSVRVRLVQMYDPNDYENEPDVHFILEIEPGNCPPWTRVQWESASDAVTCP